MKSSLNPHIVLQQKIPMNNIFEVGQQDIVLNCNYHFDSHEAEQLEVKWYFNKVIIYI